MKSYIASSSTTALGPMDRPTQNLYRNVDTPGLGLADDRPYQGWSRRMVGVCGCGGGVTAGAVRGIGGSSIGLPLLSTQTPPVS